MVLEREDSSTSSRKPAAVDLGQIYSKHAGELIRLARSWRFSPEDAEDCTQEFFLRLSERGSLKRFDGAKGRFRSFLLVLFQRFLSNLLHRRKALKRGGAAVPCSLEGGHEGDNALKDWRTPELVAEWHSAQTLVDRALNTLQREVENHGRGQVFEALLPHVLDQADSIPCARSAQRVGLSDTAARMTICRYRRRLRELICLELQRDGANPHDAISSIIEMLHR